MKKIKYILVSLAVFILAYLSGPTTPKPVLNQNLPTIQGSVENYVAAMESKPGIIIRPGCEAKILWANDSTKQPTEFVLLYLHGFSASWKEGSPVNVDFARRFGCNAFLSRLASHGLVTDNPLIDMTPELLYESAKEALVIASQLGNKVIIMGCSTGCTLALKLAADFPGKVSGLILYSPNVKIRQKRAVLTSGPWGLQIVRLNYLSAFRVTDDDPNGDICKYWYCKYRGEGIVYLQQLLDVTMKKELFARINCPVFMGYYYRDWRHQDETVDVNSAINMVNELGTPKAEKRMVAFPFAGAHVLVSPLMSKSVEDVRNATYTFAEEVLNMRSKQ